jgi:hypothetical protein
MVTAARAGESLRSIGRRFNVSLDTVRRWVERAGSQRLDRVDWSDRPDGPRRSHNRTAEATEHRVLALRQCLRDLDDLGEYGAAAIQDALVADGLTDPPSVRTIHRILDRHGVFDSRRRPRLTPPPRGWHLPDVADGRSELDYFDVVTGLVIQAGPEIEVFNGISLHGSLVSSWPTTSASAVFASESMIARWRESGLPTYAQFDNDTRFQGAHQHKDVVGTVSRLSLSLGVVPVFVPPREPGFQAAMESYNGQWQLKVWNRFHHESLPALQAQSDRYVAAHRRRRADRIEAAPSRKPFPEGWEFDLQAHPVGKLIYIRRTTANAQVEMLGRSFSVDVPVHRLVRCEVLLDEGCIRFYRLTRREPFKQPLVGEIDYQLPRRKFRRR